MVMDLSNTLSPEGDAVGRRGARSEWSNVEDRRIAPTSPSQRGLWFVDQFSPKNSAYNIAISLRLHGPLSVDALRQGIDALVERHAVFRTTFAARDGTPIQSIAPTLALPLARYDLRHLPEGERDKRVAQLTAVEARQPFDLEAGPLLRTTLLRLGAHEHHLLVTIHHIIADEWSLDLLCHELGILYTTYVSGGTSALSELPIQYGDYAQKQEAWLQSERSWQGFSYWVEQLADAPITTTIPADRPRPPVQ